MKKLLALLLILVFVLSFAACKSGDTSGDNSSTGDASSETQSSVTDTSSQPESSSADASSVQSSEAQTSSAQSSSVESEPAKPAKLNPKKNLKLANFKAKTFEENNQIYREISLYFYEELESFQFSRENYYTKEYCKKKYEGWGMAFDEENFSYEYSKEVNGVTYYNLGDFDNVAESCEVTDTIVKLWPYNNGGDILSLNADGTLVVDKANCGMLKVGTIFMPVAE